MPETVQRCFQRCPLNILGQLQTIGILVLRLAILNSFPVAQDFGPWTNSSSLSLRPDGADGRGFLDSETSAWCCPRQSREKLGEAGWWLGQKSVTLVNTKIAGTWMFILKQNARMLEYV